MFSYKFKKVLKILQSKRVNIDKLCSSKCLDDYNHGIFGQPLANSLTKEEYRLLKRYFHE